MAKFRCFSILVGKRKKDKVNEASLKECKKPLSAMPMKFEQPKKPFERDELKPTSTTVLLPSGYQNSSPGSVNVISRVNPVRVVEVAEKAYDGEDEYEETKSIKTEFSNIDYQAHAANSAVDKFDLKDTQVGYSDTEQIGEQVNDIEKEHENGKAVNMIESGHVSDPGVERAEVWASPKLKRSCSNLETRVVLNKIADQLPPPSKSQSFEELQELSEKVRENFIRPSSPCSVTSHCSADRVMLKKHSSSQILPSRSRRLWWKLFLWSHRNLHKPWISKLQVIPAGDASNQQGGYSSDTLEPSQAMQLRKTESPGSFTGEISINNFNGGYCNEKTSWNNFHNGVSALWPHNQWVAFSGEPSSSFKRVEEWVKDLEMQGPPPVNGDEINDENSIVFPPSPENGRSLARSTAHLTRRSDFNIPEEIVHANAFIRSLNSSSLVAHISGIGLKAIPTISSFSSLRTVNLSNNFIVHISAGSLPKGLHTLNLSRNKISTIEGLRELTRLRVLDLSYNRISRIGQGLSNCSLIKELYLAGNKISNIEGLHRLLKLAVLDLSFNKIITTKALGQLVANYQSLVALNLVGNPIQSNVSDDQLRKAVCSLLPKLVYLNKQPIKPQRARELLTDSVAKAVLGNGSQSSRRRMGRRVSRSASVSSAAPKSIAGVGQKSRSSSKSRLHPSKRVSPASQGHASSTR